MIILHDQQSADLAHIQAMGRIDEGFALFDYVKIEQNNGKLWIGQITQPNKNISTVGGPLDPTILHGLELMQENENIQSVSSVQVFDIQLLGQYDGSDMQTLRLRPLPGAAVKRLDAADTTRVIGLPTLASHSNGLTNVIGDLLNADDVPLCLDAPKFNYHIMISGGTGSGKSNAAANLVDQALQYGKCVLIHDAKPDYGLVAGENSDRNVSAIWSQFAKYKKGPRGVDGVTHVGFYGMCDHDAVDSVIGFHASDFNPEMLAGFFFSGINEQLQFEGFASASDLLQEEVKNKKRSSYALDDITQIVQMRMSPNFNDPNLQLNEATGKAILRKVKTRRQNMPWLDVVSKPIDKAKSNPLTQSRLDGGRADRVVGFSLENYITPGHLMVIDYSQMDEQSYALILSYFLRICHTYRKKRGDIGIVQLVDEAHRIFDNASRHENALANAFQRAMREGRTLDHSIILSLQNASQIPPLVMNNLNTKIVMRQNSKAEADSATQTMGRDFSIQALRLGTGHALVSLFESKAVVLAQMAPSPFELMRSDNTQKTEQLRGDDFEF